MSNNAVDIKKMMRKLEGVEKSIDSKALDALVIVQYLESIPDNPQDMKDALIAKKARFLRIRDEL